MSVYRQAFQVILLVFSLFAYKHATAKVNLKKYGLETVIDKARQQRTVADSFHRLILNHPQFANRKLAMDIERPHQMVDKTLDFYMLVFVCILLGVIRFLDPRYFHNLWRAFWNQTLSARQIREQMEGSAVSTLLMNIFFSIVAGAYIYYAVRLLTPGRTGNIPQPLLIFMLIAGVNLIYILKYAIIRFSGWAFNVKGITEQYIYNIFLINKILAVALLPFVILLAFADPVWTGPAMIVSMIVVVVMLISRYTRSWQVFGSFFQYSRFHFFTYLCASELLPLAVLTKLLVRGLLY